MADLYPVKIRQDLSPSERKTRALLLNSRWELIRDGIERKSIKISTNSLILDGVKYGQVVNGEFLKCDSVSNSVNNHEQCDSGLNSPNPPFADTDLTTNLPSNVSSHGSDLAEPVSVNPVSLVTTPATNPNVTNSQ